MLRGLKVPLELMNRQIIPLPSIIHWQGIHWVDFIRQKDLTNMWWQIQP